MARARARAIARIKQKGLRILFVAILTLSLMRLPHPQIALLFGSEHNEIMKVKELQTDATFQDLCNLLQLCLCAGKFSRYKVGSVIANFDL